MTEPAPSMRGSLHQPPNAEDLRRTPPTSAACARVRGLMRDCADGDLEAAQLREVHEHVVGCRVCSIELARAEHETIRLRRAFARVRADEALRIPKLPGDFASRVVERLVLDDTSSFPPRESTPVDGVGEARDVDQAERGAAGHPLAGTDERAAVGAGDEVRAERARRSSLGSPVEPTATARQAPVVLVAVALLLLLGFGAAALWLEGPDRAPERTARLVLTRGKGVYGPFGRLWSSGEGVGEKQSLSIGADGDAQLDWHDLSSQSQPAATLMLGPNGEIRLQDGEPVLRNGTMQIEATRPVNVSVDGGPTFQLGIGEYVIAADAADAMTGDSHQPTQDPLGSAPGDLRVSIEVLRGEARILHGETGSTLVAQGTVGVYESGTGFVATRPAGTQVASAAPVSRGAVPSPAAPTQSTAAVFVTERSGVPSVGTNVAMAWAAGSAARGGVGTTNANGAFVLPTEIPCESDFMILQAIPAATRLELGMRVPDAYKITWQGAEARCSGGLVMDVATALSGTVLDENGNAKLGARVLPCVVDEVFGTVLPLINRLAYSDENGWFQIHQLPSTLPPQQFLALVVAHPNERPAVVPIPARSEAAALLPLPSIVLHPLRHVQLAGLPAGTTVDVLEEIDVLPGGTAVWQRSFTTDYTGTVPIAAVGMGELWLRLGGETNPIVQKLTIDDNAPMGPLVRFVPSATQMPFSASFNATMPLAGTDLLLSATYRHQHFLLSPPPNRASGRVMVVTDSLGRAVADAQVFAVSPSGPRGRAVPHFLGFTGLNGVASLESVAGGGDIVILAPDGSSAFLAAPQQGPAAINVRVMMPGRVLLQPSARPQGNLSDRCVPIRFERLTSPLPGLDAPAYRFASENEGWEVRGLPPGTYRATVGDTPRFIIVPEGGFAYLY